MKVSFNSAKGADTANGLRVPYGPGRRTVSRWRWRLVVILAASPLLYFLITLLYHSLVIDVPGQVSMTTYALIAPATGVLTGYTPEPGRMLSPGQEVARIVDPQLEARLTLMDSEAKDLAERGQAVGSPHREGITMALEAARRQTLYRGEYLARVERLLEAGAATRAELNEARAAFEEALTALGQLNETLPYTGGRTRAEQLGKDIQALEGRAATDLAVTAAQGGQVIINSAVNGQFLLQGDVIAEVALPETVEFLAYFPTEKLRRVKVGQEVTVRLDDGRSLKATVVSLGLSARQRPTLFNTPLSGNQLTLPITLKPTESVAGLTYGLGFRAWFGLSLF